ncbi:MAG TPA: TonB-dependent receptor, partial [Bacteroidota bacterium]|nr:TonB-dependent receptor [Bacteroidota bacterium]
MKSMTKWTPLLAVVVMLLLTTSVFAQNATIRGRLTDVDSGQPLVSASVLIVGTTIGAASDADGNYTVSNVPPGSYTLRATYLGYTAQQQAITVTPDASMTADFALKQTVLQYGEVIVEVNRARARETPVAFTDIGKEQIDQRIHGQDAPLLLKGTPSLYAYSTDGVGNGEAKLFVRGFNQNYVQVLINGVPTNDPESNSVYWSNWGSVSSAAASVQVQRGAGSSLYGAGAFGGSFNIVTGNARPTRHYGVNLAFGDPQNTMYGVDLNSGLIADAYAASLRFDRKVGDGNRLG